MGKWQNDHFRLNQLKTSLNRFKLHLDSVASESLPSAIRSLKKSSFEIFRFGLRNLVWDKAVNPNQNGDLGRLGLKTYLHIGHNWPASDYVTVIQDA